VVGAERVGRRAGDGHPLGVSRWDSSRHGATGIGRGAVVVNPATRGITGGITFTGLTGIRLPRTFTAPIPILLFGLTLASDNATGVLLNNITLSLADYAELLAGTLYFNVHTVAESRWRDPRPDQRTSGVVAGAVSLDNMQEVPASTSPATGQGTVVVDAATGAVLIAYIAHTVSNAKRSAYPHQPLWVRQQRSCHPWISPISKRMWTALERISRTDVTTPRTALTSTNMTAFSRIIFTSNVS